MAILEGIQIQNFRALRDVTWGRTIYDSKADELPRLMAVIGANGVGKSTLLDALGFIGDCLGEGVEAACDKPHRGGFERLRTQGSDRPICFEIRYREGQNSRPINYTLEIGVDRHGRPIVTKERLRQRRLGQKDGQPFSFVDLTDGEGWAWSGEATKEQEGSTKITLKMSDRQVLAISTLGTLSDHPRIAQFRRFLSGWYLSYFVPELARSQPMVGADPHLDRRGENLAKYLRFIQRERPTAFKDMLVRIARKIPGLESIRSKDAPDRRLYLEFQAQGYADPFFQQDMSDGTLKLLAYLLLMEDPAPAPLIGIEEPENGLHHQLLGLLAAEFKDFASRPKGPQILITTHAPSLVDALSPEEVWLLKKGSDGFSTLQRAKDLPTVQRLFDEGIPLGSLWFSNHFGMNAG
ncbi:MAG: AAA family ATPase [Burkholderiales bacterium]|jgi:predicted ATPase|nr:AAA family ATPase [Burkholderiales bacterium]